MIRTFMLLLAIMCISAGAFSQNQLSEQEKKAGWKLLFDGNSLKGWRAYQNAQSDAWEVKNGEIVSKTEGVTKRADLITVDQYDNFELMFDWKVGKGANSGVIYRVIENTRPTFESGPEYQLIDDNGYADKLEDWQKKWRRLCHAQTYLPDCKTGW